MNKSTYQLKQELLQEQKRRVSAEYCVEVALRLHEQKRHSEAEQFLKRHYEYFPEEIKTLDDQNIVICGNYKEEKKFRYIAEDLCLKFKNVLFISAGSNRNIIDNWYDKKFIPINMTVINEDSTMQWEFFTLGEKYEGHNWISDYNIHHDVLIVDKCGTQRCYFKYDFLSINFWREMAWKIKPLYIFTNLSKEEAAEKYKNAEIIEISDED